MTPNPFQGAAPIITAQNNINQKPKVTPPTASLLNNPPLNSVYGIPPQQSNNWPIDQNSHQIPINSLGNSPSTQQLITPQDNPQTTPEKSIQQQNSNNKVEKAMNSSQKIENNKMSCDTVPNNNSMDKLKEIDTNYKAESQVEAIKNEIDPEEQEIYSKYWNSYIATIMKSKTKIRGEKVLEIFQETNLNKKTMAKVKYPVN